MPEFAHEFPLCSELMNGFERHWLLYVAALYHDIAKGRGGDHSDLGSAMRAALPSARLSHEDTDLVASWSSATCHVARRAEAGRATTPR
jgi:[protein-PII] uridylyltransferase